MMGLKERAFALLVAVSLEELVPQDHFYRHVQKVLDLSFVHDLVRERYAVVGRPSIDPVVFFKLQLVMFFEDIRSERLLMRQVADRLSVRWYLGYDLDELLPDHSTLSKIRTRYGLTVFRRFFDEIVKQCQQAKLVWGKELYIDSTQVNANADLDSLTPRFAVEARVAIQEHLAALFSEADSRTEPQETTADGATTEETGESFFSLPPVPLPAVLPKRNERNWPPKMPRDTTGSQRKVGNSEKSTASTSEGRIFGSVPPIQMRRRCASRVAGFIWATIPTMWSMGANAVSFWRYWSHPPK